MPPNQDKCRSECRLQQRPRLPAASMLPLVPAAPGEAARIRVPSRQIWVPSCQIRVPSCRQARWQARAPRGCSTDTAYVHVPATSLQVIHPSKYSDLHRASKQTYSVTTAGTGHVSLLCKGNTRWVWRKDVVGLGLSMGTRVREPCSTGAEGGGWWDGGTRPDPATSAGATLTSAAEAFWYPTHSPPPTSMHTDF